MRIFASDVVAAAIAIIASPALAGGGPRPPAHGTQVHQARATVQQDRSGVPSQAHTRFGGPRLDQRPDPNYQNPYRPSYSLNAVNPGEQHPYFQTPRAGFGYPTGNTGVYQGNGIYIIPR